MQVFIIRHGRNHVDTLFVGNQLDLDRFKNSGYRRMEPQSAELFFFDLWCVNGHTVTGIEVHPDMNTLQRFRRLSACQCLTFSPYPIIWLGDNHDGEAQGLEAFVGFDIYEAPDNSIAILADPMMYSEFSFPGL